MTATNITGTTAFLDWEGVGGSYTVQWGPCGFVQATGGSFINNIPGSSTSLTGLAGNTCYEYYVRADCGVNGTSVWNGPFAFRTAIVPAWLENFTGGYNPTVAPGTPIGWAEGLGLAANPTAFTSASSAWILDGFLNVGTTGAVRYFFSSTSTTGRDWMFTPPIDLSNGPWELYWDMGITSSSGTGPATMGNDDSLFVVISTDGGATWNRSNTLAKYHTNSGLSNTGSTYTASLAAYSGQTIRIGFYAQNTATGGTSYDMHLDNIGVRVPPSCAPPTAVISNFVGVDSANFSWTAGSGNLTYNVQWGPCGFVLGTGSSLTGLTSTTAGISGLNDNTCYDVYFQADCGAGNGGTSPWVGPITINTLCLPANLTYTETFTTWPPNCFNLISNGFSWQHNAAGYAVAPFWSFSTGTATMVTRAVNINQAAWLRFKWAHLYSSTYPDDRLVVRSHVIGSPVWDTLVDFIGPTFTSPGAGNTTPPANASDFIEEQVILNPAYVGQSIEIEFIGLTDFGPHVFIDELVVEPVPNCLPPFNLAASAITSGGATIGWQTINGTGFTLEWGPSGFTPGSSTGTLVSPASNPTVLTGLNPNTTYDVYVADTCNGTFAGPLTFTTLCLAQLSGTYTVGGAPGPNNYPTIADAILALQCGVSGPVTFNIAAASDTGSYTIGAITGASSTNTITFNGAGAGQTILVGSSGDAAVVLSGASYVTLKNMTIFSGSTNRAVWMNSQASYITLEDMTLRGDSTNTSTIYAVISTGNTATSNTANGAGVNNITLRNLDIRGGYYGITLLGNSITSFTNNFTVENVNIENSYLYGMWTYAITNLNVTGCTVQNLRLSTSGYGLYGGYLQGWNISQNYFRTNLYPIYIFTSNQASVPSSRSTIVNNMLIGGTYGLYFSNVRWMNVYHNSVVGNTSAIHFLGGTTVSDLSFKNNIFSSNTGRAFYLSGTTNGPNIDYNHNVYFTNGASVSYIGVTSYATFAAWTAADAVNNVNSLFGDPVFASSTDLHIVGTLPNDVGDNTLGITVDFDGDVRPASGSTVVDIGADEYSPKQWDALFDEFYAITSGCGDSTTEIGVVVRNLGLQTITSLTVGVNVTGGVTQTLSVSPTVNIPSLGTDSILVGTINTYAGATGVNVSGTVTLANDQDATNDAGSAGPFNFIPFEPQFYVPSSVCPDVDSTTLAAVTVAGADHGWFANPSDTIPYAEGDSLTVAVSGGQQTWYLGYVGSGVETLTTAYAGGNSCGGGVMFNITAIKNLKITGFDVSTTLAAGSPVPLTVYFIPNGTYLGNELNAGAWTTHGSTSAISAGQGNPTTEILPTPLNIPAGATYAIYLNYASAYTNGNGTNQVVSNADMTVNLGIGMCGLFSGANNPRVFNGGIIYGGEACSDIKKAVTLSFSSDTANANITWSQVVPGDIAFANGGSASGSGFVWDFGDGSAVSNTTTPSNNHTYAANGTYTVTVIANAGCNADTTTFTVNVTGIGLDEVAGVSKLLVYPNPTAGPVDVAFTSLTSGTAIIRIRNMAGQELFTTSQRVQENENARIKLNLSNMPVGVYLMSIETPMGTTQRRITVSK